MSIETRPQPIETVENLGDITNKLTTLLTLIVPEGGWEDIEYDLTKLSNDEFYKSLTIKTTVSDYIDGALTTYRTRLNPTGYGAYADYHARIGKGGPPDRNQEIDEEGFGYNSNNDNGFSWHKGDIESLAYKPETREIVENLIKALEIVEESMRTSISDQSVDAAIRRREIRKITNSNTPHSDLERAIRKDASNEAPLSVDGTTANQSEPITEKSSNFFSRLKNKLRKIFS